MGNEFDFLDFAVVNNWAITVTGDFVGGDSWQGVWGALYLATLGSSPIDGSTSAPNNGRTTCSGPATFTAVGGNQAEGDGALFSKYPALAGGSIRGGTFGTVAVQDGFLGLTTRQLRMSGQRDGHRPCPLPAVH